MHLSALLQFPLTALLEITDLFFLLLYNGQEKKITTLIKFEVITNCQHGFIIFKIMFY